MSSKYFARSGAGTDVAVGCMGVAVARGRGVMVAVGIIVAVGVTVDWGAKDEQDERTNVKSKIERMDEVNLFRMACILPLVAQINNHENIVTFSISCLLNE